MFTPEVCFDVYITYVCILIASIDLASYLCCGVCTWLALIPFTRALLRMMKRGSNTTPDTKIITGKGECEFFMNGTTGELSRISVTCTHVSETLTFRNEGIKSLATGLFNGLPLVWWVCIPECILVLPACCLWCDDRGTIEYRWQV